MKNVEDRERQCMRMAWSRIRRRGDDLWFMNRPKIKKAVDRLVKTHSVSHKTCQWQHWARGSYSRKEQEVYCIYTVVYWVAKALQRGVPYSQYYQRYRTRIRIPDWAHSAVYEIFHSLTGYVPLLNTSKRCANCDAPAYIKRPKNGGPVRCIDWCGEFWIL